MIFGYEPTRFDLPLDFLLDNIALKAYLQASHVINFLKKGLDDDFNRDAETAL